ncbi:MAG: asparagine synthase (glutamine-hydrolyzing) [Thermodesulfovibrionales bacterium]
MCGICGRINLNEAPVDRALLERMTGSLAHRGPDDSGIYLKGRAGLGHRRLSVIDLSPLGHQPMANEDGTLWIVFNGEIYNFPALREGLLGRGHVFRSKTDTETILHLYEEYGTECLRHLRGMFAFAIWDERTQALFLARDRVGKKPLYYRCGSGSFAFGSEIKAILEDDAVPRRPDLLAVHHYLTYQYVPAPWTAFEGIRKLPPGHWLLLKDGEVTTRRYWTLPYLPKLALSTDELKEEIVSRLREATRLRMISDVPLGAFLSGGVDSSAVVACMAGLSDRPVKTFSIGFQEAAYNELRFARTIAERFGTDHTEFIVEPRAVDILEKIVWHYNEPFADSSAIPTYYVSKLAREHVTVILNGDGGDESFAGYGRYAALAFSQRLHRFLPSSAACLLLRAIMPLPHGKDPTNIVWRAKRFLQEYVKPDETRNGHWLCHFSTDMKTGLYAPAFAEQAGRTDSFELLYERYREVEASDFLDKTLYADVMMYLPDDLLIKVDVASMAHSLEARSPFLDHEFMEFAARIPSGLKLKGTTTKYILKEALRGMLPDGILFREKMGFGVPLDHWFRGDLKQMAYDTLLSERAVARGYFRPERVRQILDEHATGAWNWHSHIWNLLMLELWHRVFIDG